MRPLPELEAGDARRLLCVNVCEVCTGSVYVPKFDQVCEGFISCLFMPVGYPVWHGGPDIVVPVV